MNQSMVQTITITTTPASGVSPMAPLADTGENLPAIAAIGGVLLLLAIILVIWLRHGRPQARNIRGLLSFIGVVGVVGMCIISSTRFASATGSLTLTPQNHTINVAQGSSIAIPTTATLHTTSNAGYSLTLVQSQSAAGVSATVKTDGSGSLTADTPLTSSPTTIKASTAATAAAGDMVNSTLTITAAANAVPGTSDLKLTYQLNETPPLIDPAICENANAASACQVDMDTALIPVTYTGTTSSPQWSKADVTSEGNWYNYQNKQWANAVAVTAGVRTTYQNAPAGTVIPESDVMAYYTYIPRYEYQVCRPNASDSISGITAIGCPSSTASPYNFNIKFQTAAHTTAYNGTTIGGWATHPAFTFGTTQLNGIWVGKYQTSSASAANAQSGTPGADVAIKPNQFGLWHQSISQQFATAQSLADSSSQPYEGLDAATTDSRMMTNSDWGAVAYLATSIYGKGASMPVDINNCNTSSNFNGRTGWGGGSPSANGTESCVVGSDDSGAYQTTQGQGASTTGNVTGIYDMVGGNGQYIMAHLTKEGYPAGYTDNSGFVSLPASKYFNGYDSTIFTARASDNYGNYQYCTWVTCGGQAFFETASVSPVSSFDQSWLGEFSIAINADDTWVARGGGSNAGSLAGLFSTYHNDGSSNNYGFRVVQSRF